MTHVSVKRFDLFMPTVLLRANKKSSLNEALRKKNEKFMGNEIFIVLNINGCCFIDMFRTPVIILHSQPFPHIFTSIFNNLRFCLDNLCKLASTRQVCIENKLLFVLYPHLPHLLGQFFFHFIFL